MKSWAVAKNVFRRVGKDPRTLALIIFTPLLFILMYGYSFAGSPKHLKVIIVNEDNGLASVRTEQVGRITIELKLADKFVNALNHETLEIIKSANFDYAQKQVKIGQAWAALSFPKNFSHALINAALRMTGPKEITHEGQTIRVLPSEGNENPLAVVYLDDGNPFIMPTLLQELSQAFSNLLAEQQGALKPVNLLEIHSVYNNKITALDYTAPGVIGFALTLITIMLTVISIVRERTSGTLTRLLIAPVRPWEASAGYMLAFALIALFQAAELLLVSYYLFHIHFVGNPAWIALIIFVYTIGLQGVATLLSTLARNEFQAVQYILVILIPSIMMSGVFWPLEAMPPQIQPIAWLSPLTYANSALREVMLRGRELSDITMQLGVLAGFAFLMLILSVQSMRRQAYSA
ncbi:ABC-2 transporter permease [Candidatus Acetothermia bacterium]|nr:ABC-2 transporter permease [Candidatus Acetothermia bacterium]